MNGRNEMLGKIWHKTPGIYLHISYERIGWLIFCLALLVAAVICTVDIRFNAGPKEYPFFIDNKKIIFMSYEPKSMEEARRILALYKHKFQVGDRIAPLADLIPEKK